MCLATVYKESDDSVIFKNVSRIDVQAGKYLINIAAVNNFFKSELLNCGFINFINAELEQEALYYYGTRNCCRRKRRRW